MILEQLRKNLETIDFGQVIEYIDNQYDFSPVHFKNGDIENNAGQNNGSCKIFSFAKIHHLTKEETLQLFGDFYRKDVLQNPDGNDHQNIRNFIQFGWEGIVFSGEALTEKR